MFAGIALLFLIAVALVAIVAIYNRLATLRNKVRTSWANIDVLLTQRHDELPKLVTVCKEYMKHERETIERVIEARNSVHAAAQAGDLQKLGASETGLRARIARLFAVAEAYPDLKASTLFLQLQKRISGLETSIADRRELYNDAVNVNNTGIEQFPDVLVANFFGFEASDLLKFDAASIADVDVKALMGADGPASAAR